MNRVTITLHIDLPDGVTPDVSYGTAPTAASGVSHTEATAPWGTPPADEPPLPDAPPPDQFPAFTSMCPVHRVAWKVVPAGVSKKNGKPYDSFRACPEMGCDKKP